EVALTTRRAARRSDGRVRAGAVAVTLSTAGRERPAALAVRIGPHSGELALAHRVVARVAQAAAAEAGGLAADLVHAVARGALRVPRAGGAVRLEAGDVHALALHRAVIRRRARILRHGIGGARRHPG